MLQRINTAIEYFHTIIHEIGHIVACLLTGSKINWISFEFWPIDRPGRIFGLVVLHDFKKTGSVYRQVTDACWKEIVISLAGPAANFVVAVIFWVFAVLLLINLNSPFELVLGGLYFWIGLLSWFMAFRNILSRNPGSDGYIAFLALKTRDIEKYLQTLRSDGVIDAEDKPSAFCCLFDPCREKISRYGKY